MERIEHKFPLPVLHRQVQVYVLEQSLGNVHVYSTLT